MVTKLGVYFNHSILSYHVYFLAISLVFFIHILHDSSPFKNKVLKCRTLEYVSQILKIRMYSAKVYKIRT